MAFILSSDNTQETNYSSSNVSLSGEEACPLTPLTLAGAISIDLNASGTVINKTHQHDIYICFLDMIKAPNAVHRRDKQESLWYDSNIIRTGKFESI